MEPNSVDFSLRPMTMADYPAVIALWQATEGMGLSVDDTPEGIERFLDRNPGLSLVAVAGDNTIIGAVLCGHDGRRGLLHHLAVQSDLRKCGVGRAIVARCMQNLREAGIRRCHLLVMRENLGGHDFYLKLGWRERSDVFLMTGNTE